MVRYRDAQRRSHATVSPASEHVTAHPEPVGVSPHGFSGVAWDGRYRVWVRWVDGRPVGYYAPPE